MFNFSLLLLALLVAKSHLCPSQWALNEVDIWTHKSVNHPGYHEKSVNIYDFEQNTMIQVTKGNVSVLCTGMIRNFLKLKFLALVDINISKIEPGAFQKLPALTHLSLAVNKLVAIERNQFQNLQTVQILYLSKNRIESIDEDAFYDLPNLKKIYLDRNEIHEIHPDWFVKNSNLAVIGLSLNKISKVQKRAFTLPSNGIVEIRLQNNEIEEVEDGAVASVAGEEEVPYLTLHLERNKLTGVPKKLLESLDEFHSSVFFDSNSIQCFDPESLRVLRTVSVKLYVRGNPLRCDCLEAANNFVADNEIRAVFSFNSSLDCQLSGLTPGRWGQQTYFN